MSPKPIAVLILTATFAVGSEARPQVAPFELEEYPGEATRLDRLVDSRLQALGIEAALPCSDPVFLRRVYLDVLGILPTLDEARRFLADPAPDRRTRLIDAVLARPEFADYQAMKWCDLLRVRAEFPINLWPNAVQAYHRWIHTCLRDGVPYDRFVHALLTSSGSNFRVPEVNFYRAVSERTPEGLAKAAALTFLGVRFEGWTPAQQAGFVRFFTKVGYKATREWKEEIVFFDDHLPVDGDHDRGPFTAVFPDGSEVTIRPDQDPRIVLADWLIQSGDRSLARCLCNRIWYGLLGHGIVHEPDDFRADNPPANPELLDWLADELIRSGYDQKHVFRLILSSRTYQRSAIPKSTRPDAAAHFASYSIRRVEAEVLIDAICQVTGTSESYSSRIPEPFTFMPRGQSAVGLGDGSITSAFLELFGRPPRDTGLVAERNNRNTTAQRLHLLNSSHVQRKIQTSRQLASLIRRARGRTAQVLTDLYLTILSRPPTAEELAIAERYSGSKVAGPRQVVEDLAWALLNSTEFLYRH